MRQARERPADLRFDRKRVEVWLRRQPARDRHLGDLPGNGCSKNLLRVKIPPAAPRNPAIGRRDRAGRDLHARPVEVALRTCATQRHIPHCYVPRLQGEINHRRRRHARHEPGFAAHRSRGGEPGLPGELHLHGESRGAPLKSALAIDRDRLAHLHGDSG